MKYTKTVSPVSFLLFFPVASETLKIVLITGTMFLMDSAALNRFSYSR